MMKELEIRVPAGLPVILMLFILLAASVAGFVFSLIHQEGWRAGGAGLVVLIDLLLWFGLFTVSPNEGRVLQLFGRYVGTAKVPGLRWANPFFTKRRVSLRVRNFETEKLKVNDHVGNPIEIAAVVVWKVVETAEAC